MRGQAKQHPDPPGWGLAWGRQRYVIKDCTDTETPRRIPRDATAWGANGPLARRLMTSGNESQVHLGTARPTTIISSRTTTTIGTWNVRTMYETGKKAQVATEMRNYRLSMLGIAMDWLRLAAADHREATAAFREMLSTPRVWLRCCLGLPRGH